MFRIYLQPVQVWRTRRKQHSNYEIEMCEGLELRYHTGEPAGRAGNWASWVGVKKCVGKRKTSYQARICITKRKGNKRRQYNVGTFDSAVRAAIAIAKERLKVEGPPSPQGDRKPRTCALPASRLDLFYV